MSEFKLARYLSLVPNLLYGASDHFVLASRSSCPTKEAVFTRITNWAMESVTIFDRLKTKTIPRSKKIATGPLVKIFLRQEETRPLISGLVNQDPELVNLLRDRLSELPEQETKYLVLEVIKGLDLGLIPHLNKFDSEVYRKNKGSGSIVDFAVSSAKTNPVDIHVNITSECLPSPDKIFSLLQKQEVQNSEIVKILKYISDDTSVEQIIHAVYDAKNTTNDLARLQDISHRVLDPLSKTIFNNFVASYDLKLNKIIADATKKAKINQAKIVDGLDQKIALTYWGTTTKGLA